MCSLQPWVLQKLTGCHVLKPDLHEFQHAVLESTVGSYVDG